MRADVLQCRSVEEMVWQRGLHTCINMAIVVLVSSMGEFGEEERMACEREGDRGCLMRSFVICTPNATNVIKSIWMRWARHMARIE